MLRSLVIILLQPATWVIVLALTAVYYRWRGRVSRAKYWGWTAAILFYLFSAGPVPYYLTYLLESRHPAMVSPPLALQQQPTQVDIMVLGGGHTQDSALVSLQQLSEASLRRLVEGLRLQQMLHGSRLVFSGRSSDPRRTQSTAEAMQLAAISLGSRPDAIAILPGATNTRQEARAYAATPHADRKVILVTDAIHMPRAMAAFNRVGINPFPAPASRSIRRLPYENKIRWVPSLSTLIHSGGVLKEWVGLWYAGWQKE